MREVDTDKDGRISYEEFIAMMKTGTDWRKASRQYSRERFKSLSFNLMKDGSLHLGNGIDAQPMRSSSTTANNAVIKTWGEKRIEPKLKKHVELVEQLGIAYTKKGTNLCVMLGELRGGASSTKTSIESLCNTEPHESLASHVERNDATKACCK